MGNSHSNPTEPFIEDVLKSMDFEEIDETIISEIRNFDYIASKNYIENVIDIRLLTKTLIALMIRSVKLGTNNLYLTKLLVRLTINVEIAISTKSSVAMYPDKTIIEIAKIMALVRVYWKYMPDNNIAIDYFKQIICGMKEVLDEKFRDVAYNDNDEKEHRQRQKKTISTTTLL